MSTKNDRLNNVRRCKEYYQSLDIFRWFYFITVETGWLVITACAGKDAAYPSISTQITITQLISRCGEKTNMKEHYTNL